MWRTIINSFSRLFGKSPASAPIEARETTLRVAPRVSFRATRAFMAEVRDDLMRPHAFAHERVGFIAVRAAQGAEGLILLADNYHAVADDEYLRDPSVGAMIGQEALRKALELALLKRVGVFHVHMHALSHRLWFSGTDLREQAKFVPDFFSVCPQMPHGAIVLNAKAAAGRVWLAPNQIHNIDAFDEVGARTILTRAAADGSTDFYT